MKFDFKIREEYVIYPELINMEAFRKMLKFKDKDGKVVGVLKDDASEPEGEMMKLDDRLPEFPDDVKSIEEIEAEMEEEDAK